MQSVVVPSGDAARAKRVADQAAESHESFETDDSQMFSPKATSDPLGLNQPWKILGRRWHWTAKGFPNNAQPKWPLELAEKAIAFLESMVGDRHVDLLSPTEIHFGPLPHELTWATLKTKSPESLVLMLVGPATAIDLELLKKVEIEGTVEIIDSKKTTRTKLHFNDLKQIRSRSMRSFITNHWKQTFGEL